MVKKSERKEAWFRILVAIISGVIFYLWWYVTAFLIILNWIYTIFSGKHSTSISNFCNTWVEEAKRFLSYMVFYTDERPFPFTSMKKH